MAAREQQKAQEQEAARKRRECQYLTQAPQGLNQQEAEVQNDDAEDEEELLI